MKRRTLLGALGGAAVSLIGSEMAKADVTDPDVKPDFHTVKGTSLVGAPTTADGFTQMFDNKSDAIWAGGDQNTSILINGYVYWICGDVISSPNGEDPDGSYAPGAVMVENRILLQNGDQLTNAMANGGIAVPRPPTHTSATNERYWPQAAFYANQHLYVLCQRVVHDPQEMFRCVGVEMAKFSIGANGLLTLVSMIATPSTGVVAGVGPAFIQWAGDALVHNSYVYVYGYTKAANNPYVGHFTYVARVPSNQVENPFAWRFYAKSSGTWKTNVNELNPDPASQPDGIQPSQVMSARYINGQFVLLHKPWNGMSFDGAMYLEKSSSPVGPFVRTRIFDSPNGTFEGHQYQTYGPMLHPEQPLGTGGVLVSVNWNWRSFGDITLSADLYKPRFYRVVL